MFNAVGYSLTGDHLDLSFSRPATWTKVGSGEGSPPSLWISLGHETCGPAIQLGMCPAMPQAMWLDTHYHGSDQFRAALKGDFQLQRKHMKAGDFGYQVSGIPYREGLVPSDEELWMFAVHGDRRGARATMTRKDGTLPLMNVAEDQLDRPVDSSDDPYWHALPGGSKGTPALAISTGRIVGGFGWGNYAEAESWQTLSESVKASVGLIGDIKHGPIVLTLHGAAGATIVPALTLATETTFAVVCGEVTVGAQRYVTGDVRIQRAGPSSEALIAGPDGADLAYLIADRQAILEAVRSDVSAQPWLRTLADIYATLQASLRA